MSGQRRGLRRSGRTFEPHEISFLDLLEFSRWQGLDHLCAFPRLHRAESFIGLGSEGNGKDLFNAGV